MAQFASEPCRVTAASGAERRVVVGVEAAGNLAPDETQRTVTQTLIGETAHIEAGVRLQGAQILVEEMVHRKDAEPSHQRTRRAGSAKPMSAVRSSPVIAKRATPAT